MKGFDFPIYKTKRENDPGFDLSDPAERRKYFEFKAGKEIAALREYLKDNTFIGFLMGPKNSGKGTYTKMFKEVVGDDLVAHISVGDVVRDVHKSLEDPAEKASLEAFLKARYRGFMTVDKAFDVILGRDQSTLLPTEVILALVEREIDKIGRKAIFIDGFPRSLDQVSYSLYFRSLIGYRNDPDFFTFISVPETVMEERMKTRVICPNCQTSRNTRLLRTKEVGYDKETKEFYLICDNADCGTGARMVGKEGDELGIEPIRDRIEADKSVMRQLLKLEGVPKTYLRNAVPVDQADEFVEQYEITPGYRYELNDDGSVKVIEEPWTVNDDDGVPSYSQLPAAVALGLITQTAEVLGLVDKK